MNRARLAIVLLSSLAGGAHAQSVSSTPASTLPPSVYHYSVLDESEQTSESRLGSLAVSRRYAPAYVVVAENADPVLSNMAGDAVSLVSDVRQRRNNSVRYESQALNGISASALYSYDAAPYNDYVNRAYGAVIGYTDGPVVLRIAHQRRDSFLQASGSLQPVDTSARNTMVAATVRLGLASVYAGVGQSRGDGRAPWDADNPYGAMTQSTHAVDSRDTLLGLSVPYRGVSLMASYMRKNDRDLANQDGRQVAVGLSYSLAAGTNFYAAFAKLRNARGLGTTTAPLGDSAINLGLRHAF